VLTEKQRLYEVKSSVEQEYYDDSQKSTGPKDGSSKSLMKITIYCKYVRIFNFKEQSWWIQERYRGCKYLDALIIP
jgi:hypothetical protein